MKVATASSLVNAGKKQDPEQYPGDVRATVTVETQKYILNLAENFHVSEPEAAGFLASLGLEILASDYIAGMIRTSVGTLLWEMTAKSDVPKSRGTVEVSLGYSDFENVSTHAEQYRRPLEEWLGKVIAIGVKGAESPAFLQQQMQPAYILRHLCKSVALDIRDDREAAADPTPRAFLKFEKALYEEGSKASK